MPIQKPAQLDDNLGRVAVADSWHLLQLHQDFLTGKIDLGTQDRRQMRRQTQIRQGEDTKVGDSAEAAS